MEAASVLNDFRVGDQVFLRVKLPHVLDDESGTLEATVTITKIDKTAGEVGFMGTKYQWVPEVKE